MKKLSLSPYLVLALVFAAWLGRMQVYCAALLSIFLHECAHACAAWMLDVPVEDIRLHVFGASLTLACDLQDDPKTEIAIAAAGPAASFVLSLLFHALYVLKPLEFFRLMYLYGFFFGMFNLLPALPMDGGRILRAAASGRGAARAHTLTANLGIAMGCGMIALACMAWRAYGVNFTLLCCGAVLMLSARSEKRKKGRYLLSAHAKAAMVQRGKILPVETIAVSKDLPLERLFSKLGAGKYHHIEIYDEVMQKVGQLDELQAAHLAAKYGKKISINSAYLYPYIDSRGADKV